MSEQATLDQIMAFDATSLSVFNSNNEEGSSYDANVYRTNPVKFSKSEDGHYHSRIKILYNPFDLRNSIKQHCYYAMNDADGFFMATSRLLEPEGNKKCPIFNAWKKLWFAPGDDVDTKGRKHDAKKREFARGVFEKHEEKWVLIQVLEDDNAPELVGKFMFWKLPSAVYEKLEAKQHPSVESKKQPVSIMDYLFGPALDVDVAPGPDDKGNPGRKQREISYGLCDFGDPTPIIKVDGEQLFNDEQLELIDKYTTTKTALSKAKTEKAKKEKQAELDEMTEEIKALYQVSIDYMTQNAPNLNDEFGYKEWSDELKQRVDNWIASVLKMEDPRGLSEPAVIEITEPETEPENDCTVATGMPF